MPRILIVDSYYPEVIKHLLADPSKSYSDNLANILSFAFGTGDFYSRNLKALGWDAIDVIANHRPLQDLWRKEDRAQMPGRVYPPNDIESTILRQIGHYDPDVLFMQDLSLLSPEVLKYLKTPENCDPGYEVSKMPELVGQLSCPWPGDEIVREYDCLFSSFPHYVPRIEKLGVRAVYNPLAFEPSVINGWDDRLLTTGWAELLTRIHDVVFIGGVGNPSHWKAGMQVLEAVAREISTFKWWGYGVETLPKDSALRPKYQGQAWGREMYDILKRAKICLNRHGEVAETYANNMRMYEATGCGAILVTERRENLLELFQGDEVVPYTTPVQAVSGIKMLLQEWPRSEIIGKLGQKRTLRDHTYAKRMQVVSDVLKEALVNA